MSLALRGSASDTSGLSIRLLGLSRFLRSTVRPTGCTMSSPIAYKFARFSLMPSRSTWVNYGIWASQSRGASRMKPLPAQESSSCGPGVPSTLLTPRVARVSGLWLSREGLRAGARSVAGRYSAMGGCRDASRRGGAKRGQGATCGARSCGAQAASGVSRERQGAPSLCAMAVGSVGTARMVMRPPQAVQRFTSTWKVRRKRGPRRHGRAARRVHREEVAPRARGSGCLARGLSPRPSRQTCWFSRASAVTTSAASPSRASVRAAGPGRSMGSAGTASASATEFAFFFLSDDFVRFACASGGLGTTRARPAWRVATTPCRRSRG